MPYLLFWCSCGESELWLCGFLSLHRICPQPQNLSSLRSDELESFQNNKKRRMEKSILRFLVLLWRFELQTP